MASTRKNPEKPARSRRPPATTPEARENQLVDLAIDVVERQMRDGTVSSQVLSHYVKLASPREKLERQRLMQENELLRAKIEDLGSAKRVEELYEEAILAMRDYAGQDPHDTFE